MGSCLAGAKVLHASIFFLKKNKKIKVVALSIVLLWIQVRNDSGGPGFRLFCRHHDRGWIALALS